MNPNTQVGQIDETSANSPTPAPPATVDGAKVEVVLPFPVAGLPAGMPIGTSPGQVML